MNRSTFDRLRDMIQSADIATEHVGVLDANSLAMSPGPRDAALFRLAVVCEAAGHLPPEIQALAPEVPWREIRGMRNHIVHGYWQIDLVTVVETIRRDLDVLKESALRLIALTEQNYR